MTRSLLRTLVNLLWIPPTVIYIFIRLTWLYINLKWRLFRARTICRGVFKRYGLDKDQTDLLTNKIVPKLSLIKLLSRLGEKFT